MTKPGVDCIAGPFTEAQRHAIGAATAVAVFFVVFAGMATTVQGECQTSKLTAADAVGFDFFGIKTAISSDFAVVGAWGNDDAGSESGSVYVCHRDEGGPDMWGQVAKLVAADAAQSDRFGWSMAIDGDTVVVGAVGNDDAGDNSGSVYIFARNEGGPDAWGQVTKITALDAAPSDEFGTSVAISGDTIAIGADGNDDAGDNSGSVYIFARNEGGPDMWGQVTKLTATDAAGGDLFGASVAISGHFVVAGALGNDDGGTNSGSGYVFARDEGGADNWGQVAKLVADDAAGGDLFGVSVGASGETATVGAHQNDDNGGQSGSAYIFERDCGGIDNWGQAAKLTASDAAGGDRFGISVGISGDRAIVGAHGDDVFAGSAYVFVRNLGGPEGWGQLAKLTAADRATDDRFGGSVSISGGAAVAGANRDDDAGSRSGSAYTFGCLEYEQDLQIDCPDDTTISCADSSDPLNTGTAGASDGEASVTFVDNILPGDCDQHFTIERTWTASGGFGNSVDCTQIIEVDDLSAPTITCPGNVTVTATDPGGAVVDFQVAVEDDCDPSPAAICTPPGNSTFGFGTTTVTCTANDACGNLAACSFTVTVLTPEQALQLLIEQIDRLVDDGSLNRGQGNALTSKLRAIIRRLEDGRTKPACNQLDAFVQQVTAFIRSGVLEEELGQALIDAATDAGSAAGCNFSGNGDRVAAGDAAAALGADAFLSGTCAATGAAPLMLTCLLLMAAPRRYLRRRHSRLRPLARRR